MQPGKWPQTYEEYAGFYTEKMRSRAIEAGCRTDDEVEEWLWKWYGRDQNRFLRHLRPIVVNPPPSGRITRIWLLMSGDTKTDPLLDTC